MNVANLHPQPQEKAPFQFSDYLQVPEDSGCYVLTSFDGHILYIGQSKNLQRRFEEHLDDPAKTQPTPQGRAVWFYWLLHKELHLNALERGWLNEHAAVEGNLPILNAASPPV